MSNISRAHPLTALKEDEIVVAASLVRSCHAPGTKLRFKGITLHEPSKGEMKVFDSATEPWMHPPARKAWVNYYLVGTASFYEAILDLSNKEVERQIEVPTGFHGPCDDDEILTAEKMTLADSRVQAEIAKLQLPDGAVVVCDPWIWLVPWQYLLEA